MPKVKDDQNDGIQKPIDAEEAMRIVRADILPNLSAVGEKSQEISTAYKAIKKQCNIPASIIKFVLKLEDMEDFKRDHQLRALSALFAVNKIFMPRDMVDIAEGKSSNESVIPMAGRRSHGLATIPSDDSDLAAA